MSRNILKKLKIRIVKNSIQLIIWLYIRTWIIKKLPSSIWIFKFKLILTSYVLLTILNRAIECIGIKSWINPNLNLIDSIIYFEKHSHLRLKLTDRILIGNNQLLGNLRWKYITFVNEESVHQHCVCQWKVG